MLHEIVKLRQLLSVYLGNEVSIYDLKRQTIENSLYGVDIDPGAVEICKLRLWLSLVVDEDDFYNIKPLPNLDYKVVYGNSLFGLPQNVLLNVEINKEIKYKKKILFSTTSPNEKNKIKNEIEELFKKQIDFIKTMHPQIKEIKEINFDFRIHFSEIFNEEKENRLKGFNIIIANPPYVRQERIKNLKLQLKNYFSEIYDSRADIFTYFYKNLMKFYKKTEFFALFQAISG
jgi:ribosomal protein L23